MKRRVISLILALSIVSSLLPSFVVSTAYAQELDVSIDGQSLTEGEETQSAVSADDAETVLPEDVLVTIVPEEESADETTGEMPDVSAEEPSEEESAVPEEIEEAEQVEAMPVRRITGFAELSDGQKALRLTDRVSLEEVQAALPESIGVKLDGEEDVTEIPVSWNCLGEYENTDDFYYGFTPVWDEQQYILDAQEEDIPYIGVYISDSEASQFASNEQRVYEYLTGTMGMNRAAACGILANIYCESAFNPTLYGDGGTSFGICQWHSGRFTNLKNYCSRNGYDYRSLDGQLRYLEYELKQSYSSVLSYIQAVSNSGTGAYNSGYHWCYRFEIPANTQATSVARGKLAQTDYWVRYQDSNLETVTPKLTSISGTGKKITIQWNAVSGQQGYYIYRRTSGGDWKKIASVGKSKTSYTDDSAKKTTSYYYTIRAVKTEGKTVIYSKRSNELLRVGTPVIKTAEEVTGGNSVKWDAVAGAKSYRVYRKKKKTADWTYKTTVTATQYTDNKAKLNDTYYYSIRAVCQNNSKDFYSGYSASKSSARKLTIPKITDISGTKTAITLRWNKVSTAKKYYIYRRKDSGDWKQIGSTTSLKYQDKGVEANATYRYRVRAGKPTSGTETALSDYQKDSVQRPGAVQMKDAQWKSNGVKVTWKSVYGVSKYRVYRRSSSSGKWKLLKTVSKTEYTDTSAQKGKNYYYMTRAVGKNPTSFYSGYESVRSTDGLSAPKLESVMNNSSGIKLSWKPVAGATGYRIYRKKAGASKWTVRATLSGASKSSYTDQKASEKTTYVYTVSSVKGKKIGKKDSKGLTMMRISTPALTSAEVRTKEVRVKWKKVSSAKGYYIYRRESKKGEWKQIAQIKKGSTTTYDDRSVKAGMLCEYTVRAYNGKYYSGRKADGVSAMYLLPVEIKKMTHSKTRQIDLSWSKAAGAEYYTVQYATSSSFKSSKTKKATQTSTSLTGLKVGEIYYVRVRPMKTVDGKAYSGEWSETNVIAVEE